MNSKNEFFPFSDISSQMLSVALTTLATCSQQPARMRQTTSVTLEVLGDDLREHYLLTYSPYQRNLIDVVFLEHTHLP